MHDSCEGTSGSSQGKDMTGQRKIQGTLENEIKQFFFKCLF